MKLPNGYGSVYRVRTQKLRNPWYAYKSIGWDEKTGKQIRKRVGSYPTREAALQALAAYNGDPYDLNATNVSFADMYNEYMDTAKNMGDSLQHNNKVAFKQMAEFHARPFVEIRAAEWERAINELSCKSHSKRRIRVLLSAIYALAIKKGVCKKNLSEEIHIDSSNDAPSKERIPFSDSEIAMLWEHSDATDVAMVLILIYSGVRISELLDLETSSVHLEQQYFSVKDSKTKSGIRDVPIADKVLPLWRRLEAKSKNTFFRTEKGLQWSYTHFAKNLFRPLMKSLDMEHQIHETRHTCITQLVEANVNLTIIKQIIGHKFAQDLTESVYTHVSIKAKINAINQINV